MDRSAVETDSVSEDSFSEKILSLARELYKLLFGYC